jgi:hypothetical protein
MDNQKHKEIQMKRILLTLMICLIGMSTLNAKGKPFAKGTIYINFSLTDMTSCQIKKGTASTILTGDISDFEDWRSPGEIPVFSRIARVFTLEYGQSSSLGLEFQLQSLSGFTLLFHEHSFKDPSASIPTTYLWTWPIDGYFNQLIFSVGTNYHMDFIKINGLDIYTGLQIGVEEMSIAFLDRKIFNSDSNDPSIPDVAEESVKNAPIRSVSRTNTLIYSHIAVGARYFILDRIALNARAGLKVAFAGWPMTFFYSAGLTLKL